ncbi:MAG: efflux RND transporter periplasmic adaptor subunit [Bacteroidales bacterium]|nr:efflux RND transporter periplasmic adaptor subunit [Bacteroidales bacterium]
MKKFFKILVFIVLAALVVGTFVFLWQKSKPKAVEYEAVSPEYRTIEKKTIINGKIEPRDEVLLKPQISGIITDIYKESGQFVKAGEVIAKVKVVPDISQLSSAESQLKIAKINMEQIETQYNREKKLYESGVVTAESFETTESGYLKAKEEIANAEETIDIIKEGMSKSTQQYSNTQIKSTISGMILNIPVKVGNSVIQTNTFNDGTTIATIADMNNLIFIGKVDETEVGRIKEGNEVKLTIGAMQNTSCQAILEYIAPKGTLENGATTFEIKAAVKPVDSGYIRSGYSANGEIITERHENVLSIPESTLEFSNDSTFVYVLTDAKEQENKYKKTPVTTGLSDGLFIEVVEGIDKETSIRGNVKIKSK